jgi:hypothetical protein
MKTVERKWPIMNPAAEASERQAVALERIAAALEKLTQPFAQPLTAFTPEEVKAFLKSVGDETP